MTRYDLSSKKPSTLEKARKSAAANPEVIYNYFELLESEARRLEITDRPCCFWNLDETNLCHEPSRTKVIAPKGQKASRVTATSGRENTTVLAAISGRR